jgi:hypothetical protein
MTCTIAKDLFRLWPLLSFMQGVGTLYQVDGRAIELGRKIMHLIEELGRKYPRQEVSGAGEAARSTNGDLQPAGYENRPSCRRHSSRTRTWKRTRIPWRCRHLDVSIGVTRWRTHRPPARYAGSCLGAGRGPTVSLRQRTHAKPLRGQPTGRAAFFPRFNQNELRHVRVLPVAARVA